MVVKCRTAPLPDSFRLGGLTGGLEWLDIIKPSRAEPSRAEPSRAEPSRAEPSRAEPSRAEPSRAEPSRAEPSRAEPSRAEPSRAEPSRAEPSRAEPSRAEPSRAEPRSVPAGLTAGPDSPDALRLPAGTRDPAPDLGEHHADRPDGTCFPTAVPRFPTALRDRPGVHGARPP